jgi:hypothetical protein
MKIFKIIKSFFSKKNITEAVEIVKDIEVTVEEVKQAINTLPSLPKPTPKKVAKTAPKKAKSKK